MPRGALREDYQRRAGEGTIKLSTLCERRGRSLEGWPRCTCITVFMCSRRCTINARLTMYSNARCKCCEWSCATDSKPVRSLLQRKSLSLYSIDCRSRPGETDPSPCKGCTATLMGRQNQRPLRSGRTPQEDISLKRNHVNDTAKGQVHTLTKGGHHHLSVLSNHSSHSRSTPARSSPISRPSRSIFTP